METSNTPQNQNQDERFDEAVVIGAPAEFRNVMRVSPMLVGVWSACIENDAFWAMSDTRLFQMAAGLLLALWAAGPASTLLFNTGFTDLKVVVMTCVYAIVFAVIMGARLHSDFAHMSFPHAFMLKGLTGLLMSISAVAIGISVLAMLF